MKFCIQAKDTQSSVTRRPNLGDFILYVVGAVKGTNRFSSTPFVPNYRETDIDNFYVYHMHTFVVDMY